ncbi:ABC transporter substrate-binding protein [Streptomyces sp. SID11385]|uniref:ABC transporter substrate-binding protein n=1 Tax=Streptomyces sp. SID11385 TaxID=2706031 RepID=UPI0013CC2609|nr:ABC transporter substrate-binding protein [Streptomyces sp. SID11385]NEA43827.1 ABC transporter substrate-binding protein [Streptomyces sp. SID11385]
MDHRAHCPPPLPTPAPDRGTAARRRLRPLAAAAALLALTALVGCGPSQELRRHDGLAVVHVGHLPVVDAVAFTLALDKGWFRDEGIDARADETSAGALLTNLINGTDQFALCETAGVVSAYAKGLPVHVIGGVSKAAARPEDDSGGLLVMRNGPVRKPADLNGRTVAVGQLKGGGEVALRAALDKAGADSDRVKILEMPLSDMTAALVKGRIDAMSTISPFDTTALAQGAVRLMAPGAEAAPRGMQMAVATSSVFERKNPEVVRGFRRALDKGIAYAAAHPDAVRQGLSALSPMPKKLIATMKLPVFDASTPRSSLKVWTDLMERYRFLSRPVDVDELLS